MRQVGVPEGASLEAYRPHAGQRPVLVWASSIGQGGVVQNAGLPWISHAGRVLRREVLNFGFAGLCRMQPQVATIVSDASEHAVCSLGLPVSAATGAAAALALPGLDPSLCFCSPFVSAARARPYQYRQCISP